MQATDNKGGNLLPSKAFATGLSVQHHVHLCDPFHASDWQENPKKWSTTSQEVHIFPLMISGCQMVANRSLSLCDWGLRHSEHIRVSGRTSVAKFCTWAIGRSSRCGGSTGNKGATLSTYCLLLHTTWLVTQVTVVLWSQLKSLLQNKTKWKNNHQLSCF